ncbi:hypothetical protein ACRQ5Q_43435 (plasmid) [Bradyrhizobium sp. PMVTL-01]|uniref:hypothetical protein n=1 Tax=Bradyrhizobium sp. PMVTL-01 TaxID=3434999 RepID=UPI003F7046D7
MLRLIIALVLAVQLTSSFVSATDIRRIVTGPDAADRSTALFDTPVRLEEIRPDLSLGYLCVTHAFPVDLSHADTKEEAAGTSPPPTEHSSGWSSFGRLIPPIRLHLCGTARALLIT